MFDVVNGFLPFLIGLPSQLATGATLNFRFNSLPMLIHKTIHSLDLTRVNSSLRMPLECKPSHLSPLKNKSFKNATLAENNSTLYSSPNIHYYYLGLSPSDNNDIMEGSNGYHADILHNGKIKSADFYRIRSAPDITMKIHRHTIGVNDETIKEDEVAPPSQEVRRRQIESPTVTEEKGETPNPELSRESKKLIEEARVSSKTQQEHGRLHREAHT